MFFRLCLVVLGGAFFVGVRKQKKKHTQVIQSHAQHNIHIPRILFGTK